MTLLYLDTNALVKLVLLENDSTLVEATISATGSICSSVIAYAEARATISRQFHEKRQLAQHDASSITRLQEEHEEVVREFRLLWNDVNQVDVTQEISELAGDLTVAHPGLRGMDVLHLASALYVHRQIPVNMLTFDRRLHVAAQAMLGQQALINAHG